MGMPPRARAALLFILHYFEYPMTTARLTNESCLSPNPKRRAFLKSALGLASMAIWSGRASMIASQRSKKVIEEDDPANTKLAHRLNAREITDDDLLFLKQIGMRWARLEFSSGPTSFEYLRSTQQRFAHYGIRIFSGVHYAYRSLKVQLGQPGRDQ